MASGLIRCEHCGQTNRVPAAAAGTPRCGKCHQPLPWIADADDASGSAHESSSVTPKETVASRTPAARATARIPPGPSARASAPISSRRCRSSR